MLDVYREHLVILEQVITTTTTVDYVLMDLDAVSLLRSCETLSEADLNTSDHLPFAVDIMCGSVGRLEEGDSIAKIDWDGARRSGNLLGYMAEVKERLAPFLNGSYIDVVQVDEEIKQVAWLLTDVAKKTLPTVGGKGKKRRWFRDAVLKSACTQSKEARGIWKDAGCPSEGELFDHRVESRRAVRMRIRECAAREERRRIQKRERLFRSGAPSRFRLPQRRKKSCLKLMRDGGIVSDKEEMLKIWAQHFESLATSGVSEREELRSLAEKMQELTEGSMSQMRDLLREAGILHINQTADAIFATQFGSVGTFQDVPKPSSSSRHSFTRHSDSTSSDITLIISFRIQFSHPYKSTGMTHVSITDLLDAGFKTPFTDELLSGAESMDLRDVRKEIRKIDSEKMLEECAEKSQLIVEVGWSKLWDSVMDLVPRHVRGLQNLSRMLSAHWRGNRPCPLCDEELEGLLAEHIMEEHRD